MMAKLGMKLETTKSSGGVVCKINCPYAGQVHPLMSTRVPVCPISILALGAIRLMGDDMVTGRVSFTDSGAEVTMLPNPVKKDKAKNSTSR